jgi:hypothetical protein
MLNKKYEMIENPPEAIEWEDYEKLSLQKYRNLLTLHPDNEKVFQTFLERNPSFVPGAFSLLGESGHYPYLGTLIAQPKLFGVIERNPDFMWLSTDSLTFSPILIEIERPNKRIFTASGVQSAEFSQATNQLLEWKTILKQPENILMFYNMYLIPDWLREREFKPIYCLIYGSRDEFEGNQVLKRKRAGLMREDEVLMSFDRLNPNPKARFMICSTVKNGDYIVNSVPPTYKLGPNIAEYHSKVSKFKEAVKDIEYISSERKEFLTERYDYWKEFGELKQQGIINTGDLE